MVPPENATTADDAEKDFKYFVDMPLREDALQVQAAFDEWFGRETPIHKINRSELSAFLRQHFEEAVVNEEAVSLEKWGQIKFKKSID